MPAPAVYVAAFIGAAAAGYAFKEFVYEPHLAPVIHQWAADFQSLREARRRRGQYAPPVQVPGNPFSDEAPTPRSAVPMGSTSGVDGHDNLWRQSVVELQNLAQRERSEWGGGDQDGLRRRHGAATDSVGTLPLESFNQPERHWQNSRPEMEELISLSRSSSLTMSTPSAHSPPSIIFSASRPISPEVVSTSPNLPPVVHTSPRSPFVDAGGSDDFNLTDWTPTSPELSASRSNLTDSFAELDVPTPIATAPPRADTASPFTSRTSTSDILSSEGSTHDATDISLSFDDDLSDLGSNDGSDISGWQSVGQSPQLH